MIKWEYMICELFLDLDDDGLNQLGRKGWELITIKNKKKPSKRVYYFKRQIIEEPTNERLAFKRLLDTFGSEESVKGAIESLKSEIETLKESLDQ